MSDYEKTLIFIEQYYQLMNTAEGLSLKSIELLQGGYLKLDKQHCNSFAYNMLGLLLIYLKTNK